MSYYQIQLAQSRGISLSHPCTLPLYLHPPPSLSLGCRRRECQHHDLPSFDLPGDTPTSKIKRAGSTRFKDSILKGKEKKKRWLSYGTSVVTHVSKEKERKKTGRYARCCHLNHKNVLRLFPIFCFVEIKVAGSCAAKGRADYVPQAFSTVCKHTNSDKQRG